MGLAICYTTTVGIPVPVHTQKSHGNRSRYDSDMLWYNHQDGKWLRGNEARKGECIGKQG